MSDTVLVALISTLGLVLVALIGVLFQGRRNGRRIDKVHDKAEVVRNEVQNSHSENLRDAIDVIRDEMRDGFKGIADRQDAAAQSVVEVRTEALQKAEAVDLKVGDLTKRLDRHIDSAAK